MLAFTLGLLLSAVRQGPPAATTAAGRYQALLREYPGPTGDYINDHRDRGRAASRAFLDFAADQPDAPEAVEALGWVASHCVFTAEAGVALNALAATYAKAPNLAPVVARVDLMYGAPFAPAERLFRAALTDSPHRDVRGRATLALADELAARNKGEPFALIGVYADPDVAALKTAVDSGAVTWRSWCDGGADGPISARWAVADRPRAFAIDADGVIRHKITAGQNMESVVAGLLGELGSRP